VICLQTFQAETPIKMNRTVQTVPKSEEGGFQAGLMRSGTKFLQSYREKPANDSGKQADSDKYEKA